MPKSALPGGWGGGNRDDPPEAASRGPALTAGIRTMKSRKARRWLRGARIGRRHGQPENERGGIHTCRGGELPEVMEGGTAQARGRLDRAAARAGGVTGGFPFSAMGSNAAAPSLNADVLRGAPDLPGDGGIVGMGKQGVWHVLPCDFQSGHDGEGGGGLGGKSGPLDGTAARGHDAAENRGSWPCPGRCVVFRYSPPGCFRHPGGAFI